MKRQDQPEIESAWNNQSVEQIQDLSTGLNALNIEDHLW